LSAAGWSFKQIDFKEVSSAALASLPRLVASWLPAGKKENAEWKAPNPTRADNKVGSFSINLNTGMWSDFATGDKGGDAISLYAYLHGISQLEAAKDVAGQLGMDVGDTSQERPLAQHAAVEKTAKPRTEWLPILPVPSDAGEYPKAHSVRGRPNMRWEYRNQAGALLGVIFRFTKSDGGKDILPCVYATHPVSGKSEWHWMSFPKPRPLYGLDRLRDGYPVLIVEGEKCADEGLRVLGDTFDVLSWAGGGKAVGHADWSPLAGRNVIIWPDCDAQREKLSKAELADAMPPELKPYLDEANQPGIKAAEAVAQQAMAHGAKVKLLRIPAIGEVKSGWDIADAIAEGWDAQQLKDFLRNNQRPPADSPAPLAQAVTDAPKVLETPKIDTLLSHYALIHGKTDVWDSLKRQLMKKAGFTALVGKDLAKAWLESPDRRTIDADTLPRLKRGRAVEGGGGDRLTELLARFVLLYGTVTVWDNDARKVMTLESLRAAYSGDLVKRWQEHSARLMIDAENLVFDPTQKCDTDTHVNMFEGYPVHPALDDKLCHPFIDLLCELCGAEDKPADMVHWVLCWIAYQFQHPGAKMQTAILMFGEKQGTGKSLFWEGIVRPLFGEYGTTAGQHQLDSQFTEWRSRKLFVLFEEVLSRNDRYNHLGTIKHMITGRDMRINPKGLPERVEANHLNCVFLSNEPQPIPLELEDRRFMVIEAKNRIQDTFKNEVVHALNNGGIPAFYHYLLAYDTGDFDPHTKPPLTKAKGNIIAFGLSSWEVFWRNWKSGSLQLPVCSCITSDLYLVYRRWCDKAYEKPLTLTKFSCLLSTRETKTRKEIQIGSKQSILSVFVLEMENEIESVSKQCNRFRDSANIEGASWV
jgi:putative DNA primase/helicase